MTEQVTPAPQSRTSARDAANSGCPQRRSQRRRHGQPANSDWTCWWRGRAAGRIAPNGVRQTRFIVDCHGLAMGEHASQKRGGPDRILYQNNISILSTCRARNEYVRDVFEFAAQAPFQDYDPADRGRRPRPRSELLICLLAAGPLFFTAFARLAFACLVAGPERDSGSYGASSIAFPRRCAP